MLELKKIKEETLVNNGFRKCVSKYFDIGNGKISNFLISSHIGDKKASIIIPITKDNEVIYIKEFRYGIEDFIYSFPMGAVGFSETSYGTAKKELEEEIGYESFDLKFLGTTIVANYDENLVDFYFSKCNKKGQQNLENGEFIEVFKCSIIEFEEKIKSGIINCPLTITCYTLAKLNGYI